MGKFQASKDFVRAYFDKIEHCTPEQTQAVLREFVADDYKWEGVYPFMYQQGASDVAQVFWKPLKESLYRMQRRQDVFMAGIAKGDGRIWVMSMGQFMGLFDRDYLGIRRTRKMQHLQYVEFTCVEHGKITETAMFVDILGMMKEAGQYPLMAETGSYFVYPGPRDHNGLLFIDNPNEQEAEEKAQASMDLVHRMDMDLMSLRGTNDHLPELLAKTWSPDMIWYGPCGVGASYTIPRYQEQHQIPFRELLCDFKSVGSYGSYFAEGDFVCAFGHMAVTPTGGWLGMPGTNRSVFLHGDLDIWYIKDGMLSENWCLFDIPHWLSLQGVDVFKRAQAICNPSD